MNKKISILSEIFGGLAATLVTLPSAIAFGIVIFTPLGASFLSQGALAGILGAISLGLIAPLFGGTQRLITAPCAPAAAVLSTLVVEIIKPGSHEGIKPEMIPVILTSVICLTGIFQFLTGLLGGGKLIKYVPFPVVDGYLSGVGALILLGQIPKFLGTPKGISLWHGLTTPSIWLWQGVVIGTITIGLMFLAPKITKKIPASIIALTFGLITYFLLAMFYPELKELSGNKLVIGHLETGSGAQFLKAFIDRFYSLSAFSALDSQLLLKFILVPSLTLAVLLSIDTLKTCVVLDAITRSRHNSNRELIGQGIGNFFTSLIGGLAGAGTMGATLMNISSGGQSKLSSVLAGVFALLTFLLFSKLVAWVPLASLAGILIVVGIRMIDWKSIKLLKHRSTSFDFFVVLSVIVTAIAVNLIAAAGVGVGLAILLFLREQMRNSVVRRKTFGNQIFSKKRRLAAEMKILEAEGTKTVIFELQGSLFFGTTDQLFTELEPHLTKAKYIILDLKKIRTVDFTATHMLEQIEAQVTENQSYLLLSNLPTNLSSGQSLQTYFDEVGLLEAKRNVKIFYELDEALEWVEDEIIKEKIHKTIEKSLNINEIELFKNFSESAQNALKNCLLEKSYQIGEKIFMQGDPGDELYIIRKGIVKILLPLPNGKLHHLATFTQGDFLGDMS
ncbi:MAG: SLC26A/SulP transporter family protein, partial [Deltaproteobacteria bacterium]|nr:SLC26A/SulP transporter family protein [Deltaproteobacteria bacterium]